LKGSADLKHIVLRFVLPLSLFLWFLSNNMPVCAVRPVSLKLWHIWDNDRAFQTVLENFSKAYPHIKLVIDGTPYGYETKIKTAIAANEAPDIFFTWGGGFSAPFVRAGKVLPLDDYLNDGTRNRLLQGSLTNFSYGGKVYALPTSLAIGVLFCNRSLFAKYGAKIPETYQELIDAVTIFNDNGIQPIIVGEKDLWTGMFWYDVLALRTAGARLCHKALTKKASFDRPEFTDAAAKLAELIQLNSFGAQALELTQEESIEMFVQGKAAMFFNGTWVSASLEKLGSSVKGKVVAKRFPLVEGGKGTATEFLGGPSDSFMVSANTKHQKEAVQAVKYICEEMSKQSYINGFGLPLWKVSIGDTSKINPLIIEQAKMVKNATSFVTWWDVFLQGSDASIHKSLVQKLFTGTITPKRYSLEMQKLNQKR
jgi:raffinose/stachyose/melibiose transport system substrate-binding protein